jgi:hypothetical protein
VPFGGWCASLYADFKDRFVVVVRCSRFVIGDCLNLRLLSSHFLPKGVSTLSWWRGLRDSVTLGALPTFFLTTVRETNDRGDSLR